MEIPNNRYLAPRSASGWWANWSSNPIIGLSTRDRPVARACHATRKSLHRKSLRPPRDRRSRRHGDASVSCGQFPRYNFLRERQTRGRSSPSFRRIVAAAYQSPDRSVVSRTTALAFHFGNFSHDTHFAHFRIAIDDWEDVRRKDRGACVIDRPERLVTPSIDVTSPVNRCDSFASVCCGFGAGGIENCCLREESSSLWNKGRWNCNVQQNELIQLLKGK